MTEDKSRVCAYCKIVAQRMLRDPITILRGSGQTDDALIFESVRDELRRCAELILKEIGKH